MKDVSRRLMLVMASVFIISCATVEHGVPSLPEEEERAVPLEYTAPLVYGQGFGDSFEAAVDSALRDGARKAAEALLGPGAALKNQEVLDRLFSGAVLPEAQVLYKENSIETLNTEKVPDSEGSTAIIRGRLDLPVLLEHLRKEGIPEELLPGSAELAELEDETVPAYAEAYLAAVPEPEKSQPNPLAGDVREAASLDIEDLGRLQLNDAEKERLAQYLGSLSFMVYTGQDAEDSKLHSREAALELSRLLVQYGYTCHYPDQADKILEGQGETYREETGGEIPQLQWAANKLGADIYVLMDSEIDLREDTEGFYANASVKVDLINTRSWEKTDSLSSRESPPAFSAVSEHEAVSFALRSVLLDLVPEIISSARESYSRFLVRGIPYELVLVNPPDQRNVKLFIEALEDDVRRIRRISASSGEARYELSFLGNVEDLEALLYTTASAVEGFEDFSPAYQRGNELAFYTGLF